MSWYTFSLFAVRMQRKWLNRCEGTNQESMEICEGSAKIFLLESITVESENGWNGLGELPAPRRFMQEACFQTGQQAA